MTFSQDLLTRAQPIMTAIMAHPFVVAIANGTVPDNVLNYYVEQDEHYLKDYLTITALAVTQTDNSDDISKLLDVAQFVGNESKAHDVMLGITGHQVENWRRGPETQLYVNHMYESAYRGTYADTLAALLPCAWSYEVMGRELVAAGANNEENPLKEWIELYAPNDASKSYTIWRLAALNREVTHLTPEQQEHVAQTFLLSLEMEWRFWEAAWQQENWQFNF